MNNYCIDSACLALVLLQCCSDTCVSAPLNKDSIAANFCSRVWQIQTDKDKMQTAIVYKQTVSTSILKKQEQLAAAFALANAHTQPGQFTLCGCQKS